MVALALYDQAVAVVQPAMLVFYTTADQA